jgi:hypothetical protein
MEIDRNEKGGSEKKFLVKRYGYRHFTIPKFSANLNNGPCHRNWTFPLGPHDLRTLLGQVEGEPHSHSSAGQGVLFRSGSQSLSEPHFGQAFRRSQNLEVGHYTYLSQWWLN